jgi:phosphoribosylglycinamide formyltransferase-1
VAQAAVPVLPHDTEQALAARVLKQEHKLYPQAIRWFAEGRLTLTEDGRVNLNGTLQPDTTLHSPQEA